MKPVPQTVLYGDDAYSNGNCVDACIASLMELPLWMVPQFYQMWVQAAAELKVTFLGCHLPRKQAQNKPWYREFSKKPW